MKKILLVYSDEKAHLPRVPLSILAVGSYLRKKGFNSTLLDLRIDGYANIDFNEFDYVGISCMTGVGIKYGRELSKKAKEQNKNIKIIWGGHHPTILPEQTMKDKYVDYVIEGEGEDKLVDFLNGEKIERGFMDLNELDLPAYDLINLSKYSDSKEDFSYESSRGCPHRCSFCHSCNFNKQKWRAKSSDKVLKELDIIVREYNPKRIAFVEDNFFVDKKRVIDICKGIIDKRYKFKWSASVRANYLKEYDDNDMELLVKSGCWNFIIGAESGSQRMLDIFKKDLKKEDIKEAVKKAVRFNIVPQLSFIIGYPEETKDDLMKTFDFYDRITNIGKEVEINGLFIFTPLIGTESYKIAIEKGYVPKNSFKEWGDWKFNSNKNNAWLSDNQKTYLKTISIISRFKFFIHRMNYHGEEYRKLKLGSSQNKILYKILVPLFKWSANIRWKYRFFSFGYEWKLFDYMKSKKFGIT